MMVMLVLQSIYMNQIKEMIYLDLYWLIINTEMYLISTEDHAIEGKLNNQCRNKDWLPEKCAMYWKTTVLV